MKMSRWIGVLCATALLATLGAFRVQRAIPEVRVDEPTFGHTRSTSMDSLSQVLEEAEDVTSSNDPFRLANAPSSVRYDPNNEGTIAGAASYVPPPIRPNMILKAIVGGPPWQAMVDGIPGQPPGTLVRAGSTFDKLVAKDVGRDSVVIRGPDTTWVLTFRRRP